MLITGYVERVTNKNGIWAVVVDNVRYGFYKTEPKCKENDYVSFEADQKGDFWNAKPATLKRAQPPAGQAQSDTAPAKSTWVPDAARQDSITFQSARKDALQLVEILAAKDLIDLGTKSKKADAIGVIELYVDRFTERFFEDTKLLKPATSRTSAPVASDSGVNVANDSFQDDTDLPF